MALGRTYSVALVGLNGYIVEVEADIGQTLPAFMILGLPDASLNEAKERIRSAAQNSGIPLSRRKITANLIPASLPKRGSGFDLAIAMAALLASNDIRPTGRTVFIAELGLDGRLRPVRGVLPAVMAAVRAGYADVVVAQANVAEAELVPGARVQGYATLARLAFDFGADPQDLALDFEPEPEDLVHPGRRRRSRPSAAGHARCLRAGRRAEGTGSRRRRRPPPAADGPAGRGEDDAGRTAARAAAGPGRRRGHGGDRHPLAVLADLGLRAARAPAALREPAPHRHGGGHHRRRVRAAAARGGVPGPPRRAVPRRGPGIRAPASWTRCGSRWRAGSSSSTVRPGPRPTPPASSWCSRPTRVPAARPRARGSTASAPPRCAGGTWPGCPGRCWTGSTSSSRSSGCRWPTSASPRPRRIPPPSRRGSGRPGTASWSGCCHSGWKPTPRCRGGVLRGALRLGAPTTRILDHALERGVLTARGYDRVLRLAWTLADLALRDVPERRRRRAGAGPSAGRRGLTRAALAPPPTQPIPPAVRKEPP